MKKILFFLLILFCNQAIAQTSITPDGLVLPNKALISTTDVVTVPSPVIGQSVYNTNAGITGTGASGAGFYTWNGSLWVGNPNPVPSGGIVLSTVHPNTALLSAGFLLLGSYTIPNFSAYNAACNNFNLANLSPSLGMINTNLWSEMKLLSVGNKIFYTQGTSTYGSNSYSILDASTNTFTPRSNSGILVTGGKISQYNSWATLGSQLCVWGGKFWDGVTVSTNVPNSKLYKLTDETNNLWTEMPFTLPSGIDSRELASMIEYSGKLIVFGGYQYNSSSVKNDGMIIDVATGTATVLTPPVGFLGRLAPKLFVIGNKLIIFGGFKTYQNFSGIVNGMTEMNDGIIYDLIANTWTTISSINAPAYSNPANTIAYPMGMQSYNINESNGKLYYIGIDGTSSSFTYQTKILDPTTNTWTNFAGSPPTFSFRKGFSSAIVNGKLIVYGGQGGTGLNIQTGSMWDFYSGTWTDFMLTDNIPPYSSANGRKNFQMLFSPLLNTIYITGTMDSMGFGTIMSKFNDPCFSTPTPTIFYMYSK